MQPSAADAHPVLQHNSKTQSTGRLYLIVVLRLPDITHTHVLKTQGTETAPHMTMNTLCPFSIHTPLAHVLGKRTLMLMQLAADSPVPCS